MSTRASRSKGAAASPPRAPPKKRSAPAAASSAATAAADSEQQNGVSKKARTTSKAKANEPVNMPAVGAVVAASARRAASRTTSRARSPPKEAAPAAAAAPAPKRGRSPAEQADATEPSPAKKPRGKKSAAPKKAASAASARASPSRSPSASPSRSRSASPVALAKQVGDAVRKSIAAAARKSVAAASAQIKKTKSSPSPSPSRSRSRSASPEPAQEVRRGRSRSRSMSQGPSGPAAAAAAPSVPSRGNSSLNKRASSVVMPAEPVVEEESEYSESEGEEVPAGGAPAAAAPAAAASTPRRLSSSASSNSTASLDGPSHFGVSIGEFSAEPAAGGLKKLPRQSTFPLTPKGRGVSTLLRDLADVPIPEAIFLSPFPLDTAKGHRKSRASMKGHDNQTPEETAAAALQDYDKSESESEEQEEGEQKRANSIKKLRPTPSQVAAERAKKSSSNASASSKKDTPTISRARSRMQGSSSDALTTHPASIKETRGSSIAEEFADRPGRRASDSRSGVTVTKTSDGGLIRNVDSTFPWLTAALLLLVLSQFILLGSVGKPSEDLVGLNIWVLRVQNFLNNTLARYVQPYLPADFKLPAVDLTCFDRSFENSYAQYWLVPTLYILAGYVVKKAFEVTARDAVFITGPEALESTSRKQSQYARHVFAAINAFAGALSFWAFFMASEKYGVNGSAHAVRTPAAAPVAGQAAAAAPTASVVPVFDHNWYAAQLIISTCSWSLSELLNFSDVFSGVHSLLFALVTMVTEMAYWQIFPAGLLLTFPSPLLKVLDMLRSWLASVPLSTNVLLFPLLSFQASEALKALAGLAYGPLGRMMLWLVPVAYAYGLFVTHQLTEQMAWGVQGQLLLLTLAVLSTWEILNHRNQIIVRRSKQ